MKRRRRPLKKSIFELVISWKICLHYGWYHSIWLVICLDLFFSPCVCVCLSSLVYLLVAGECENKNYWSIQSYNLDDTLHTVVHSRILHFTWNLSISILTWMGNKIPCKNCVVDCDDAYFLVYVCVGKTKQNRTQPNRTKSNQIQNEIVPEKYE